jgi:ABC-2 type transport system permease protein
VEVHRDQQGICFTHGVVLTLAWAVIIATTSRVTAGEIEKGTADLLLTLPVTRGEVYFSTSLVWFLAATILSICPVIGVWLGIQLFVEEVIDTRVYFRPALNFFFLLLAIGGISSMVSCLIDRRGLAVAVIIGILLASTVLNFIEPFIEGIGNIRFLGLLNYFRPVDVVRAGQWPVFEMVVLALIGIICWTIGLTAFCRKDIPTA